MGYSRAALLIQSMDGNDVDLHAMSCGRVKLCNQCILADLAQTQKMYASLTPDLTKILVQFVYFQLLLNPHHLGPRVRNVLAGN